MQKRSTSILVSFQVRSSDSEHQKFWKLPNRATPTVRTLVDPTRQDLSSADLTYNNRLTSLKAEKNWSDITLNGLFP